MTAPYELRAATEADLEFLLALRAATMSEHLRNAGLVQSTDESRERVLAQYAHARIVVRDGHDVGLFKLVPAEPDWELWQVQLLPGMQRQGVGASLVHRAISDAAAAGHGVTLSVLKSNPARRLYERFGFRVVGESAHGLTMRRPCGGWPAGTSAPPAPSPGGAAGPA